MSYSSVSHMQHQIAAKDAEIGHLKRQLEVIHAHADAEMQRAMDLAAQLAETQQARESDFDEHCEISHRLAEERDHAYVLLRRAEEDLRLLRMKVK